MNLLEGLGVGRPVGFGSGASAPGVAFGRRDFAFGRYVFHAFSGVWTWLCLDGTLPTRTAAGSRLRESPCTTKKGYGGDRMPRNW